MGHGTCPTAHKSQKIHTYLLRTIGTAMEGFFLRPSMISAALSAYILWSAFRWMTSDVPPRVLSKRNLACSSADNRESFFCIASKTRIVARLVSRTTSSLKQKNKRVLSGLSPEHSQAGRIRRVSSASN